MKKIFLFLLLAFIPGILPAQTSGCASSAEKALELSGFTHDMEQSVDLMTSEDFLRQISRGGTESEDFKNIFLPVLKQNFNGARLKAELLRRVAAHCDAQQMSAAVEALQSPLVAQMLQMEKAGKDPAKQDQLKRFVDALSIATPSDKRMRAIQAVDDGAGATEFALKASISTITAMLAVFPQGEQAAEQFRQHDKEMRARFEQSIQYAMLFQYQGASNADLLSYAKELSSPPLKGFYDQVKKCFLDTMQEHSRTLGQDLKTAIDSKRASQ
jgi:hypothetical protein